MLSYLLQLLHFSLFDELAHSFEVLLLRLDYLSYPAGVWSVSAINYRLLVLLSGFFKQRIGHIHQSKVHTFTYRAELASLLSFEWRL